MMSDKTLGEVAFGAHYYTLLGRPVERHYWEKSSAQDAWQAAAEAVLNHEAMYDVRGSNERKAVIEAAKAFMEANKPEDGADWLRLSEWSTYHALESAVEALREVEDK